MRFIGDVHAKFDQYLSIINDCTESLQVGDFGAGFDPLPPMRSLNKFIRGNHDDPAECAKSPHWIPDGTIYNGMFCLGGALSIDQHKRTEGVDWWRDEECSIGALNTFMDVYTDAKPEIVITHDCPEDVAVELFMKGPMNMGRSKIAYPSATRQALQAMFEAHQPRLWIFGHWHMRRDCVIGGTRFVCLAELEYIDL